MANVCSGRPALNTSGVSLSCPLHPDYPYLDITINIHANTVKTNNPHNAMYNTSAIDDNLDTVVTASKLDCVPPIHTALSWELHALFISPDPQ
ncbi:hypothetical protein GDO81_008456 [Engystomops pustulosus]|uniref:Uncharacterized protein n=1 Tax=Engystomops pustulosus TaxID=76066 RepID=A0AAV7CFV7_ENGPU|nr:hypothetical protein GDO81_008456 [Engystomops pustulosus]